MIRVPFLTPVNRMLDCIKHDQILELRLARPPVNALSPALVAQLRPAIADAAGQGFRAVVLSGISTKPKLTFWNRRVLKKSDRRPPFPTRGNVPNNRRYTDL